MKRTASFVSLIGLTVVLSGGAAVVAAKQPASDQVINAQTIEAAHVLRAEFRGHEAAADVHHIADWSIHSGDNRGFPFIVVDKVNAKAYAFDRYGTLIDSTSILIGMGVGDKFAPGVLKMDMYKTKPWQRITPAGRYFAEEDRNLQGETVLWVDYDAGIAIHRLPSKRTKQRRQERIVSPNPTEHRITYGCINVPPAFYNRVVAPYFGPKGGVVYVLPDSTPLQAVFRTQETAPRAVTRTAAGDRPATTQRF